MGEIKNGWGRKFILKVVSEEDGVSKI